MLKGRTLPAWLNSAIKEQNKAPVVSAKINSVHTAKKGRRINPLSLPKRKLKSLKHK